MTNTGLQGIEILEAWDAHRRRSRFMRATRARYLASAALVAAVWRRARRRIAA